MGFVDELYDYVTGGYQVKSSIIIAYANAYHADGKTVGGFRSRSVRRRAQNLPDEESKVALRRMKTLDGLFLTSQSQNL